MSQCRCLVPGPPVPVTVHDAPGGDQIVGYLCSVCHEPWRDLVEPSEPLADPAPPLTGFPLLVVRVGTAAALVGVACLTVIGAMLLGWFIGYVVYHLVAAVTG